MIPLLLSHLGQVEMQFFAPLGVEESNWNMVLVVASKTIVEPLQRVCRLVRPATISHAEPLFSNALSQVLTTPVNRHVNVAILTLLQCIVYILQKIFYSRKIESAQVCLHRIAFDSRAFKKVHAGYGNERFHIRQSFFGDHNLIFDIGPMKDKRGIPSREREIFG